MPSNLAEKVCLCECHGPEYDQDPCAACAGQVAVGDGPAGGPVQIMEDPAHYCPWVRESIEDARLADIQEENDPSDCDDGNLDQEDDY